MKALARLIISWVAAAGLWFAALALWWYAPVLAALALGGCGVLVLVGLGVGMGKRTR